MEITKEVLERNNIQVLLYHTRFGVYDFKIVQDGKELKPYLAVGKGYRKICVWADINGVGKQLNYARLIYTFLGEQNPDK